MTEIVTGVAGFIGSHLAARLLADGASVVGIDAFTDYYPPERKWANVAPLLRDSRFRLLELDLAVAPLDGLLAGASVIYHLAAQPGVRGSWGPGFEPYVRNNIVATQRLLEAIRGTGARLVFASSSSIYGEAEAERTAEDRAPRPVSPYGVSKLCSEQLVMAYARSAEVDARCVRYFTVYGPRQRPDMAFARFIGAALRGEPVDVYGDGSQTRDFTFVADAVEATTRAGRVADPHEAIFNVGGGSRASVTEVLAILGTILARPIAVRSLASQLGDVRHTGADLTRVASVLDWRPAVALVDGLRKQVEAAQEIA
jgi:nucleoside-diphosphate-sugar epimerase